MIRATFHDSLRYQGKGDPATLLADLDALAILSTQAQESKTQWIFVLVVWLAACLLITLVSGFVLWPLGLFGAIGGAILFGILIYKASRLILDKRRLKLARSVVRHLGIDVARKEALELTLDFNDYHQSAYQTESARSVGAYSRTTYRLPWLILTGELADGSRVELGTDLIARRKERAKRKGRSKVKEQICEHVALVLRVRSLPEHAPRRWPELVRKAPLPPGVYLHRAQVKEGRLVLHVRTHRQLRVTNKGTVEVGQGLEGKLANRHTILAPLLAAYHALAGCRRGA